MWVMTLLSRLWQQARLWWLGRNGRLLLGGTPALLVGVAVLTLVVVCQLTSAREVENRYQEQAKAAFKAGHFQQALTCYERLAAVGESPEVLYRLALSAEALNDAGRAGQLLSELAPPDHQGYGPAHYWMARQILMLPNASPQTLAAARTHLVRALDGELEDRDAVHALLGQVYLNQGRLDDAELHLNRALRTKPMLRLALARLYVLRKDLPRARREAELTVNFYRARAKTDLTNHQARLTWADATTFLEDFPAAVAILEEGLTATRLPAYRAALARVYVSWYDARKPEKDPVNGDRLELLEKGLRADPTYTPLLDRLLAVIQTKGGDAERMRKLLQGLLADGKGSATTHFVLGADALQRGQEGEARVHWERAYQLDPNLPVVANNLAWLLVRSPAKDLSRALMLIDQAVGMAPNQGRFRDTRGQILARMGRWKEALADLEAALPSAPQSRELHRTLADVYTHLGVPAMAAEHRSRAEQPPPRRSAP